MHKFNRKKKYFLNTNYVDYYAQIHAEENLRENSTSVALYECNVSFLYAFRTTSTDGVI